MLLTGDLLHLPVQAAHPTWPSSHDEDPETGRRFAAPRPRSAAGDGWLVGVPHFARPFGRVDDAGWRSVGPADAGADAP